MLDNVAYGPCTVAVDATGGDSRDTVAVVDAVRFAFAMYPKMQLIIFGSSQLQTDLIKANLDVKRYEFRLAQQSIPQDEPPRSVLKNFPNSAMYKALECLKAGEAHAMLSAGGTGPLVALARHILGVQSFGKERVSFKTKNGMARLDGKVRPCFAGRIPVGPERFSIMLDLGANASCTAEDLYDFAALGAAYAKLNLGVDNPRVAILNVGTELGKGSKLVQNAKHLIEQDRSLYYTGFIEANRIFNDDADVIVTDGFTGNIALKAAEGVADLFAGTNGLKKVIGKMARPDWLLPWQYNGSLLLGVNGVVVKSHASAGKEAFAVAMVEASRAANANIAKELGEALASDKR